MSKDDLYMHNPWRRPGNAPVYDACGMAGGGPHWVSTGLSFRNTTHAIQGDLGSKVLPRAPTGVVWRRGDEVEATWSLRANHGGGYQVRWTRKTSTACNHDHNHLCHHFLNHLQTTRHYQVPPTTTTTAHHHHHHHHPHTHHIHCHRLARSPAHARTLPRLTQYRLCPLSDDLTEECFKRTPIPFAAKTWLLWGDGTRMAINGTYLDEGTEPVNSTWAMNPLPFSDNSTGPEFAPPCDETVDRHVNDTGRCSGRFPYAVSIVDALVVPSDLSPGPYVLGFRYDCEATAQVWSSCADIDIV
jgi:hypothetical protein